MLQNLTIMFKANWEKTSVTHTVQAEEIKAIVGVAYPTKKLISYELLVGGCSNLNFKIQLDDEDHPLLLRIYLRDKNVAYIEQKITTLLKPNLPVPLVYYVGELRGYSFAMEEFIHGIPLRDLLLSHTPHDLSAIMNDVGTLLSKIASYQCPRAGFFDKELNVPFDAPFDILTFAQQCLNHKTVLTILTSKMISKTHNILEKNSHLLPHENEKHLVHGDFDPANILVDHTHGTWRVTGILDWEFSFSGSILWDVANMLRYAHKMPPAFQNIFIESLEKGGITLPNHWQKTTHLLTLIALLDCLQRADIHLQPKRCEDIRNLIRHNVHTLTTHK